VKPVKTQKTDFTVTGFAPRAFSKHKKAAARECLNPRADGYAPQAEQPDFAGYTRSNPPSLKEPVTKKWTVLAYLAGDGNIEEVMADGLLQMEKAGSTPEMNLLAQIDRGKEPALWKTGGVAGSARYYVTQSDDPEKISSPAVKELGEVDTSKPEPLKEFLSWGMKNYPARNYLVFLSGHGAGVTGLLRDDGAGGNYLAPTELGSALREAEKEAGVKKEQVVLGISACLSAQAETAYEVKDEAAYLLASQSAIGTGAWKLDQLFGKKGVENYNPAQMAEYLFKENTVDRVQFTPIGMPTLKPLIETHSLVDLKAMPGFAEALKNFRTALTQSPQNRAELKQIIEIESRAAYFDNTPLTHFVSDLGTLAGKIARDKDPHDPKLQKAAQNLEQALKAAVLKNAHKSDPEFDRSQGLGIFAPGDASLFKEAGYEKLALEKDTGWSEALSAYAPGIGPEEMNDFLGETPVKDERLAKVAAQARKVLENPALEKELVSAVKDLKTIHKKPDLTPLGKIGESFARLNQIEGMGDLWKALKASGAPGGMKEFQKSMEPALRYPMQKASETPALAPACLKAGFIALSALEGEISSRTLGEGAEKLLIDSEKIKNSREKQTFLAAGAEVLTMLGYGTQNPKIVNLKNYSGTDKSAFLHNLSRLRKKG